MKHLLPVASPVVWFHYVMQRPFGGLAELLLGVLGCAWIICCRFPRGTTSTVTWWCLLIIMHGRFAFFAFCF